MTKIDEYLTRDTWSLQHNDPVKQRREDYAAGFAEGYRVANWHGRHDAFCADGYEMSLLDPRAPKDKLTKAAERVAEQTIP